MARPTNAAHAFEKLRSAQATRWPHWRLAGRKHSRMLYRTPPGAVSCVPRWKVPGSKAMTVPATEDIAAVAAGVPPEFVDPVSDFYIYALTSGAFGVLSGDVLAVTGRPPVSFAEYAAGAAPAWRR